MEPENLIMPGLEVEAVVRFENGPHGEVWKCRISIYGQGNIEFFMPAGFLSPGDAVDLIIKKRNVDRH